MRSAPWKVVTIIFYLQVKTLEFHIFLLFQRTVLFSATHVDVPNSTFSFIPLVDVRFLYSRLNIYISLNIMLFQFLIYLLGCGIPRFRISHYLNFSFFLLLSDLYVILELQFTRIITRNNGNESGNIL